MSCLWVSTSLPILSDGWAAGQEAIEEVSPCLDGAVVLQHVPSLGLFPGMEGDGKGVHEDVRPYQAELGQESLRLLAGIADQGSTHEREALGRARIGGDSHQSRAAIQAAAIEHRPECIPEGGRVADLGLVVRHGIQEGLHGPDRPGVGLREFGSWDRF